jgi:ribosome-associated protein
MLPRTLPITDQLTLPLGELEFRATPAGGPGGQHVNRSATRIELWWNVAESPSLDPVQRARLLARLGTRLDGNGRLRIVAASRRSQLQNREEAVARLVTTVRNALRVAKPRRKTRVPRASREARLAAKRRRGDLKHSRRPVRDDE